MNMFSITGPEYPTPAPNLDTIVLVDDLGFSHERGGPLRGTTVVDEMTKGPGFVNWYCYGNYYRFQTFDSTDEYVYISDNYDNENESIMGNGLDNVVDEYSIAFAHFRNAGACDKGNCLVDGWTYLNTHDTDGNPVICGGTGILANTRKFYYHGKTTSLEWSFFKYLNKGKNLQNEPRYSRISFADQMAKGDYGYYTCLSYNVFCCPEQKLWTGNPENLKVNISDITDNSFIVETEANAPFTICVMDRDYLSNPDPDSVEVVKATSDNQQKTFNVNLDNVYVTITKLNHKPWLHTPVPTPEPTPAGNIVF